MNAATKAMAILQKIQHDISENKEISVKLDSIMNIIAQGLNADACACYITVDDTYLELFCKYGIDNEYKTNNMYITFLKMDKVPRLYKKYKLMINDSYVDAYKLDGDSKILVYGQNIERKEKNYFNKITWKINNLKKKNCREKSLQFFI